MDTHITLGLCKEEGNSVVYPRLRPSEKELLDCGYYIKTFHYPVRLTHVTQYVQAGSRLNQIWYRNVPDEVSLLAIFQGSNLVLCKRNKFGGFDFHSENDFPAKIVDSWFCWYKNGQPFRDGTSPSAINIENGSYDFTNKKGQWHREVGPALYHPKRGWYWYHNHKLIKKVGINEISN